MGVSANGAELAAKLGKAANAIERARRDMVTAAAMEMKQALVAEITRDTRDGRLSGVGRNGVKVGAGFTVSGTRNPTALMAPRGPVWLIDRNTSPHWITSRHARGSRAGRARALGGNAYRASRRTGPVVSSLGHGPPAPGGAAGGGRRAVILIPGTGHRRRARHPGTRGKRTWSRGVRIGTPAAARALGGQLSTTIRGIF